MDPTPTELKALTDITKVFEWLEMDTPLVKAVQAAMGTSKSLRSWARIPEGRFMDTIEKLEVTLENDTTRKITPMEEGQAGEVVRIAKLALCGPTDPMRPSAPGRLGDGVVPATGGLPGAGGDRPREEPPGDGDLSHASLGGGPVGAGAADLPAGGTSVDRPAAAGMGSAGSVQPGVGIVPGELGSAKVKLASVLDQGDDTEIKPLGVLQLRDMIAKWKETANDGEEPQEGEEATGDQISALAFRIRSGGLRS